MDKIQCHAVIQCLKKNGLSSQIIPEHMNKTSGEENTPSYTMVKKSLAEFRRGRDNIQDDSHSGGRPATTMN